MGRYMTQEERDEIHKLRGLGWRYKTIAAQIGRSSSAVSYIINHAPPLRKIPKEGYKSIFEDPSMEELDYSKLPDSALFEYKNYYNY